MFFLTHAARCGYRLLKLMAVNKKETTMKALRIGGISALLVLCFGIAVGQDVTHDVDEAATKTGHVIRQTTTKVGKATKTGAKDVGHGTKVAAKDTEKDVKTGAEPQVLTTGAGQH